MIARIYSKELENVLSSETSNPVAFRAHCDEALPRTACLDLVARYRELVTLDALRFEHTVASGVYFFSYCVIHGYHLPVVPVDAQARLVTLQTSGMSETLIGVLLREQPRLS